jgi:hypothetical protein
MLICFPDIRARCQHEVHDNCTVGYAIIVPEREKTRKTHGAESFWRSFQFLRSRDLFRKITVLKEQGPSSEDNISSFSQGISRNVWKRTCILSLTKASQLTLSWTILMQPKNPALQLTQLHQTLPKTCEDLLMCNHHLELSPLCISASLNNLDIN